MKQKEIEHYVELLASNMALQANFAGFAGTSKKMLLVEGKTDQIFMKKVIREDVRCTTVNGAFSNEQMRSMSQDEMSFHHKMVIMEVVYGLAVFPALIQTKGLEKLSLYGLVDRDFDPEEAHTNTKKLFITDTHDLETLMLSSDSGIFSRLEKCTVTEEQLHTAYFISYQLAYLRSAINQNVPKEFSTTPIRAGLYDMDYDRFVEEGRISVPRLILYMSEFRENGFSEQKTEPIIKKVLSAKTIKSKTDKDGTWKQSADGFHPGRIKDFFEIVNGHDILSVLRYYNPEAKEAYARCKSYAMNRQFETDLINTYDFSMFKTTELYRKMKAEEIVS